MSVVHCMINSALVQLFLRFSLSLLFDVKSIIVSQLEFENKKEKNLS